MNASLLSLFGQLEQQREKYSQWVQQANPAVAHVTTNPQQWSAAQVIYHLVQIDNQVTKTIKKSLTIAEKLPRASLQSNARVMLLRLFLKLPLKFKAPKVLGNVPEEVDLQQVLAEWASSRSQLKSILENYPQHLEFKSVFKHPYSDKMTLRQTLTFLQEHAAHHQAQLMRALQQPL